MFINRFNYVSTEKHCFEKVNNEPSETIPDQSYTINEIITRFTGGILPNINRDVSYDDEPSFDSEDVTRRPDFDLVDALETLESLSQKFESEKAAAQLEQTTQTAPVTKPDNTETTVSTTTQA